MRRAKDRELVTPASFECWIDTHYQALYRHALWMVGETELAADLVQETYYQAWKGRHALRDESKAFSWLLTILRRGIFQEYGRASRQRIGLSELGAQALTSAQVGDASDLMDFARAFQRLSPSHREMILLNTLHGLSYTEIGAQLNIPIGTVMSRLARAREELTQALHATERPANNVVPLRGLPNIR